MRGAVRAYDVRTGKLAWTFRTIPQAGEFGNETWENDSWAYTGNTGVWAQISVDEELGMAYLPVELPTHDYYGGARPGNTLFAESLVAVDLKTGVRKWHFQLVHHGVWDMDIPCAPILADIVVNGRTIKAVAQPSKQGFLYVFDRVTGQPIWPIEERPVPQGDVPGEKYSATQPFPTRPAAYDRQGLSVDDLIDFTPELRAEAVKLIEKYRIGPIFTPPVVSKAEGPIATLAMATQGPATNWPGGSYDPETHILYVHSQSQVAQLGLVPPPEGAAPDVRYHQGTVLTGARRTGGSGSADDERAGRQHQRHPGPGAADRQAAVRPHQRHQPRYRRHPLAGAARRDAGSREEPSRAQGAEHPADRPQRQRGHAGHQDAGDRRRARLRAHAVRRTRLDAARLRQAHRRRGRRRLHARTAVRVADDLHAERQAVPRAWPSAAANYSGELVAFALPN